jgi:glutamyl-tRNA reductase
VTATPESGEDMVLTMVGVSHRTAPLELRERFVFASDRVPVALTDLADGRSATEAVLLSTCNRTEIYAIAPDGAEGEGSLRELLARRFGAPVGECDHLMYERRGREAAEHLFRVAAGLDSMMLGEPQIQGQVREAYQQAAAVSGERGPVVGPVLNRLFQQALGVGGRVRSETELGRGAASAPTAAVELARKIFGSLRDRRALVVGAGEMSEATLECLRSEGVASTLVTSRTYGRAAEVAERWRGRAIEWDELGAELRSVDIVICSTAAPHPVLTVDAVRAAFPGGAPRPICIVDIAVPRDVEPEVGAETNIFLYNLDDLKQVVDANVGRRRSELPRAEALVAEGADEFWRWHTSLAVVPTIRDLRARGEELRRAEVARVLRRLGHLPEEDREAVDQMTRALLNKLLHGPTVRLREAVGNGRGASALDEIRYLFELDERGGGADPSAAELTPSPAQGLPQDDNIDLMDDQ